LVDTPTGRLRVAAPVDFGGQFVAPLVAELQARYPDLGLDLVLGSAFADLIESGIDVAVRIGALPDSSLIAKRIGSVPRVIVASRDYLEASGIPRHPSELSNHPFVFYANSQRDLKFTLTKGGERETVTVYGSITANSVTAIRIMVKAGRGLHLGPVWAFENELMEGSIVKLLPDFELEAFPLHVLYPASNFVPAKTRIFIGAFDKAMRSNSAIESA
jgi:DNA-binding transcriptional LysR family regulator